MCEDEMGRGCAGDGESEADEARSDEAKVELERETKGKGKREMTKPSARTRAKHKRTKIKASNYYRGFTVDDKPVSVPNADHGGYGKWQASPLDFVVVCQHGKTLDGHDYTLRNFARVLGRIVEVEPSASSLDGQDRKIISEDHLAVLMLSEDGTFTYIRWIPATEIEVCYAVGQQFGEFARFFFSSDLDGFSVADLAYLSSYGTLCANHDDSSNYGYSTFRAAAVIEERDRRWRVSLGLEKEE